MRTTYVLDACALFAFLNEELGSDIIERLLRQAEHAECALYINQLNVLEIYYGVFRDVSQTKAADVLTTIRALPLTIVKGLSDSVFAEAGRIKATYKVSLADSIALAEAKTRDVPLVTSDHHEFDALEAENELHFLWIR